MKYSDVIGFWFDEVEAELWWKKDEAFDRSIADRFSVLHRAAAGCELFAWRQTPLGRLAEIIVLDQFSRNIYRDSPLAFACDSLALCLAQHAIGAGADRELDAGKRLFCYMPFMHSESRLMHEAALALFTELGLESNLTFELKHKEIIDRFGRYPHRNAVLGRTSTPAELAFLQQPGSSF